MSKHNSNIWKQFDFEKFNKEELPYKKQRSIVQRIGILLLLYIVYMFLATLSRYY